MSLLIRKLSARWQQQLKWCHVAWWCCNSNNNNMSCCGIFRSALESNACIWQILLHAAHINTLFNSITAACGSPTVHCGQTKRFSMLSSLLLSPSRRASIDFHTFVARLAWSLAVIAHLDTLLPALATISLQLVFYNPYANWRWGLQHTIYLNDLVRSSNELNALINVLKM